MFKSVLTKLFFKILTIPLILVGCSANDSIPDKPLSQRVTVTVSSGEDMPITRTTPLSWYSDVITVVDAEANGQAASNDFKDFLKQSIQDNLKSKGFSFTEEGDTSRYQLVVVAMLGDQQAASNVKQLFQLYPSLSGESPKYPKGTILVGILDQQISRAVWRGATQAFTSTTLTEDERRQRISHTIGGLLKNVKPGS
jgi:hypothetical protein